MHIHVVVEREQAVEELEQRLQEREGLDDIELGCELEAIITCESNLNSHEATLEMEQKALEDSRLTVVSRGVAADVRETDLDTRAVELVEREKRLAERQMQELATSQKRLEESQVSQARPGPLWCPLASVPSTLVSRRMRLMQCFHS
jgi:hypothetical protein